MLRRRARRQTMQTQARGGVISYWDKRGVARTPVDVASIPDAHAGCSAHLAKHSGFCRNLKLLSRIAADRGGLSAGACSCPRIDANKRESNQPVLPRINVVET